MRAFHSTLPALQDLVNFLKGIRRRGKHLVIDEAGIELSAYPGASPPPNPEAGRLLLYARLSGAGKMQIRVIFPTGASQVIAEEV